MYVLNSLSIVDEELVYTFCFPVASEGPPLISKHASVQIVVENAL